MLIFVFGHWACGILAPQSGVELHPLKWKCAALTSGPPGKPSCDGTVLLKARSQTSETGISEVPL